MGHARRRTAWGRLRLTAQLWKARGETGARLTFRCPWCDVVGTAPACGRHETRGAVWLLAGCPEPSCGRGVLIEVPSAEPWGEIDTGERGLLLARSCVHPRQGPRAADSSPQVRCAAGVNARPLPAEDS